MITFNEGGTASGIIISKSDVVFSFLLPPITYVVLAPRKLYFPGFEGALTAYFIILAFVGSNLSIVYLRILFSPSHSAFLSKISTTVKSSGTISTTSISVISSSVLFLNINEIVIISPSSR